MRQINRVIALTLLGAASSAQSPHHDGTPMEQLRHQFAAARPARPSELLGTWVAVREVWTQNSLTGRIGRDHVEADERGLRRNAPVHDTVGRPQSSVPGHPLEWELTFQRKGDILQATSQVPWEPTGDTSLVTFQKNGDFVFRKDYGGDAAWTYRCRAAGDRRITCLLTNSAGHGVEFRKIDGSSVR